jgi:hypothetical protein
MKSQHAAYINSFVLIVIGFWGYAANNFATHTAIIPLSAGILFLGMALLLKKEKKILLIFIIFPLLRNARQSDIWGMIRISIEMLASAMALIVYLRNYIQINKHKATHV